MLSIFELALLLQKSQVVIHLRAGNLLPIDAVLDEVLPLGAVVNFPLAPEKR
jgi:hypothetical protein